MLRPALIAAALIVVTALAMPAQAQPPEDGTNAQIQVSGNRANLTLWGGFQPNPLSIFLQARGMNSSSALWGSPHCPGWYLSPSEFDNANILWIASVDEMTVSVNSSTDTVLMIRSTSSGDEKIYCDDNSGGGHNPQIRLTPDPAAAHPSRRHIAGSYQIYIGTKVQNQMVPVNLVISEAPPGTNSPNPDLVAAAPPNLPNLVRDTGPNAGVSTASVTGRVDPDLPARDANLTLSGGFQPDPVDVDLIPGGDFQLSGLTCTGWYHDAPNAEVYYHGNGAPLSIMVRQSANAGVDTELAVRAPNGLWLCDDNSSMGTEPILTFPNAASGNYDVYVGTQARRTTESVVLAFSASDLRRHSETAVSYAANPALPAVYGTINLFRGFAPDPYSVNVLAGGPHIFGSPQGSCSGWVSEAPSLELNYNGGGRLVVSASSQLDTIVVVRGPDGYWHCDDDGGNSGLNAAVTLNEALSGTYDIWVGTHRQTGSRAAILQISERHSQ